MSVIQALPLCPSQDRRAAGASVDGPGSHPSGGPGPGGGAGGEEFQVQGAQEEGGDHERCGQWHW